MVLALLLFESRLLSLLGGGGGCGTLNDFFSSTDISGGFVIIGVCLFFVEAISEDLDIEERLLKTDEVFLRKRFLGNKLQMQHMKDTNDVRVNDQWSLEECCHPHEKTIHRTTMSRLKLSYYFTIRILILHTTYIIILSNADTSPSKFELVSSIPRCDAL